MKTYSMSIIVNQFVTQIVSNTERIYAYLSKFYIEHTVSSNEIYRRNVLIYVISTNTGSGLTSIGCYLVICPLKCQTINVKISDNDKGKLALSVAIFLTSFFVAVHA